MSGNLEAPGPVPILLLEDNPDDFHLFRRAVERAGYVVDLVWAQSTEEALALLDSRAPSAFKLMVMDIRLPHLSGIECLLALKKRPRWQWIPKIIFSTSALDMDIRNALDAGANGYVQKPLQLTDHDRAVKTLLEFWVDQHCVPTSSGNLP